MMKYADGQISPTGETIASLMSATKESVLQAREKYKQKRALESEEYRRKKAEEERKIQQEKEAEQRKLAYIKSLKDVGSSREIVKKIYDANRYDMRVLGKEMRKYSLHNPQLVIEMLGYMGYTESDNLAYNITSNFSDAELSSLDRKLIHELATYLKAGWELDKEEKQRKRIELIINLGIETSDVNYSKHVSYQSMYTGEKNVLKTAAHINQNDNEFKRSSKEMYNGKSYNSSDIKSSNMCNITSLAMVLCSLEREKVVKAKTIALLQKHGKDIEENKLVEYQDKQLEDLIGELFEQLGIEYFVEKGLYKKGIGAYHPHQVATCLNHVGQMINQSIKVKAIEGTIGSFEKTYKNKVLQEIEQGGAVYVGTSMTNSGHIITVIGIKDDGILVNDPYGSLLHELKSYLTHGSEISTKTKLINAQKELLKTRLKYNTKELELLEKQLAEGKGKISSHLGERNFYTWDEVKKYSIGKYIVAIKK